MISELGDGVIDAALGQLRRWLNQGLAIKLSINLSMAQLHQADLAQRMKRALQRHRIDPALVTFEITESMAMLDTVATLRSISALVGLGASMSIDDFGVGYSSLSSLRQIPAREIKLDRSFVTDLTTSADACAIAEAVIRLAHALRLTVVAEGVETPAQRDLLLGLNCDEMQGYWFARPMPADALAVWLKSWPGKQPVAVVEMQ